MKFWGECVIIRYDKVFAEKIMMKTRPGLEGQ